MKPSHLLTASLLAVVCALPASARDHQGDHKDKDSHRVSDRDHDRDSREDVHRDRERDFQHERAENRRDEREARLRHEREERWRHAHHAQGQHGFRDRDNDAAEHPGWDHGKKRGWKDDNLPPGQAKKS